MQEMGRTPPRGSVGQCQALSIHARTVDHAWITQARAGPRTAPGMRHTDRVPRVYRADHTAYIRDRLKRQALSFAIGVIMAVLASITLANLLSLHSEAQYTLTAVGWELVIALALVSGVGLMLTAVQYLAYLRRRPDLDAAGAEVMGELRARLHRLHDDK
jgi:hypothetical protein